MGAASPRTMKWRSMFRIPLAYTYRRERGNIPTGLFYFIPIQVEFFLSLRVNYFNFGLNNLQYKVDHMYFRII